MFSKEMEALIQATLEDGKLEDNEKAALVKRAQKEGIDIDELEIYINSLLQRKQRELKEKNDAINANLDKEKQEAFGLTCPNCGKQVPPLTLKCDCGYEFTTKKGVSSVQSFFEKINNIQLTESEIDSCSTIVEESHGLNYRTVKDADGNVVKKVDDKKIAELKERKQIELISSFPVPNTKEDIVEFLSMSITNSKKRPTHFVWKLILSIIIVIIGLIFALWAISAAESIDEDTKAVVWMGLVIMALFVIISTVLICRTPSKIKHHNEIATIWRTKFDQVMMKGRSLRGDAEFQRQLDYFENMLNK